MTNCRQGAWTEEMSQGEFTHHPLRSGLWIALLCVHVCVCTCVWLNGKGEETRPPYASLSLSRLLLSYLVVILQHLSDDSYLWVVVLYGDYSEKENMKAEAGFTLTLESDGKINLITPEWSRMWGQHPGPS